MDHLLVFVQIMFILPTLGGSVYALMCVVAVYVFSRRPTAVPEESSVVWPPVSILKPVHGLEKHLEANLRSACTQDYSDYQVVLAVQRLDDPALPLLRDLQRDYEETRVTIAIADSTPIVNGKVQNLLIALGVARHDVLVISDSDVRLPRDYLRTIVSPLRDPQVGYVCTLYRATCAERWFERLELLTFNADFIVSLMFARVTKISTFCLGPSLALRRSTLQLIGGLEALADYLVEDYEMGRRIEAKGFRGVVVPYFVDTVVDLQSAADWWRHQVYWDQNTWAARPYGFLATVLTRSVPFAVLFALVRGADLIGCTVLTLAVLIRLATVGSILRRLGDREGLQSLGLLPLRDLAGLASWGLTLCKRTFVWRGLEFGLTRDGRIVPLVLFLGSAVPLMGSIQSMPVAYQRTISVVLMTFSICIGLFFLVQRYRAVSRLGSWMGQVGSGAHLRTLLRVVQGVEDQVVALLFVVPANLGTQEASLLVMCDLVTGVPALGVAAALLRRVRELVWIAWGLVVGWTFSLRPPRNFPPSDRTATAAPTVHDTMRQSHS